MNGHLGILNVGMGDTKLSFDRENPTERARAAKIVTDMLRRGYAILVQVGEKDGKPLYMRAEAFDESTCDYLIVGLPEEMERELAGAHSPGEAEATPTQGTSRRGRPRKVTRVDATKARATAIARSAGG